MEQTEKTKNTKKQKQSVRQTFGRTLIGSVATPVSRPLTHSFIHTQTHTYNYIHTYKRLCNLPPSVGKDQSKIGTGLARSAEVSIVPQSEPQSQQRPGRRQQMTTRRMSRYKRTV
ncbi:unnamed protein product [Ceratitis capitata]|uniref:(Mediterranean fruit fly) hypothetical protein n=1 Tax=Ceratitis capitata TaxID=7213 RepID=A0A811UYF6_CERCA|nr:unnamed protein product [Ceratitis capitata]